MFYLFNKTNKEAVILQMVHRGKKTFYKPLIQLLNLYLEVLNIIRTKTVSQHYYLSSLRIRSIKS